MNKIFKATADSDEEKNMMKRKILPPTPIL